MDFSVEGRDAKCLAFGDGNAEWRREDRRLSDYPATPGRPVFSFNTSVAKNSCPSKWDDAHKWLTPNHYEAHLHLLKLHASKAEPFVDKSKLTDEKVSFFPPSGSAPTRCGDAFSKETTREFINSFSEMMKMKKNAENGAIVAAIHRDVGTEMTPLGSSKTSRCDTPFMNSSPSRHNTPASTSGPISVTTNNPVRMNQLEECHFRNLGTHYDASANWSTRDDDENNISKSLTASDSKAMATWEAEKAKCCSRYKREEAKVQAWINLQNAKAEAQSKKLEVKILKMRSKMEDKLMKRMAAVNRKAEERRAVLRREHSDDWVQRSNCGRGTCGCFPCTRPL